MKRISSNPRSAVTTTVIVAIVVVIIVVAAVGAYAASASGKTSTVVSTSVVTTGTTATETSTAVSTSVATSTVVSTSVSTSTAVSTSISTSVATSTVSASTLALSGSLTMAGSTLVQPLMSVWTFGYTQVQPNVQPNYQSVGSGAGITDITSKTVEIGATDAPLSTAQYAALPATVVTIPESISAVVPAYNIPGISNGLNFTGNILAQMFYGTITMWNDPQLVAINPGVTLPAHAIQIVHRSDGSGTMYAFDNYLIDSNAQWKSINPIPSTTPTWGPGGTVGLGCKGNEGVAGCIENTPYAIGPLEIAYAIQNPTLISVGNVKNAAGNYITASGCTSTSGVVSCSASTIDAAVSAGASVGLPAGNAVWTPVSIINNIFNDTSATTAYPITTFTYLVMYQVQSALGPAELAVGFAWWAVNTAQNAGVALGYIPLPSNVVTLDDTTLQSVTYSGTSVCTQVSGLCA